MIYSCKHVDVISNTSHLLTLLITSNEQFTKSTSNFSNVATKSLGFHQQHHALMTHACSIVRISNENAQMSSHYMLSTKCKPTTFDLCDCVEHKDTQVVKKRIHICISMVTSYFRFPSLPTHTYVLHKHIDKHDYKHRYGLSKFLSIIN